MSQASRMLGTMQIPGGRKSAFVANGAAPDIDIEKRLQMLPMMIEPYAQIKRMTDEQKEEQYQRMGLPTIKRKRIHFKTIERFPECVLRYFKPGQILLQDDPENVGGLRQSLLKFQDLIHEALQEHPELGPTGSQQRLVPTNYKSKAVNPNGLFGTGDSNDGLQDGYCTDYVLEYLQEINEYICGGMYSEIFGRNYGMNREERLFQDKLEHLASWVTPQDFGIPETHMNPTNMPMWQKAIKEL